MVCDRCGALLYEGKELKDTHEIVESYDGKCPNCGKKLSYIPKTVEIKPAQKIKKEGSWRGRGCGRYLHYTLVPPNRRIARACSRFGLILSSV